MVGDPFEDVLYGPMINQRFADRFEEWLGLVEDHHEVSGSTATGRITADNPREGFVGDPADGLYFHPTIVARRDRRRRHLLHRDVRPASSASPASATSTRRSSWPTATATGCRPRSTPATPPTRSGSASACSAGMLSVNNSTSGAEAHLPFGGNGKSGNGSRLSGMWVLDQFTRWQSMNWDYAGKLQKAQMDIDDVEADLDFRL